jgi:hypothetical protein
VSDHGKIVGTTFWRNTGVAVGTSVVIMMGVIFPIKTIGQSADSVPSIEELEKQLEKRKARQSSAPAVHKKTESAAKPTPAVNPEAQLRADLLQTELNQAVAATHGGRRSIGSIN